MAEMFKGVAHSSSLTGRRLNQQACLALGAEFFHLTEALDDGLKALFFCRFRRGSGMEVQEGDLEFVTPLDLFFKCLQTLFENLRIRRAEVDEIAVVAHHLFDPGLSERLMPESDLVIRDALAVPGPLIACKELDGGRSDLSASEEGVVHTPLC